MKIYCINLARATERREKMEKQAAALGLAFSYIEAVDGKSLTDTQRARVDHEARRHISPYPLTDNEIGCWLSHLQAMELLVTSGDAMAVIIEDDAALSPDFPQVMEALEKQQPSFDIIDLHRLFKKGEIFALCRPLVPGYGLGRIGYTHMQTTGYFISRTGAQRFLAHAQRFAHAIDKEMHRYWINGLDLYGFERPLALVDDGGHSYIDESRGQDRPRERQAYPDADKFYWRLQRRWSRLKDTLGKRMAFPAYVKRGKAA